MFTGIIETVGTIREASSDGKNRVFWVESDLAGELRPDQSISHNGVCLTVEEVLPPLHKVTAVEETLQITSLDSWAPGTRVNLERGMRPDGRLDGHLVQGHVDTTGVCTGIADREGSKEYTFTFNEKFSRLLIEKGSVAVNGISLTCFRVAADNFTIAIIPYTAAHTNIRDVTVGSKVNLEFDLLGKYVNRQINRQ